MSPVLSIIIPAYNVERFVEAAIHSALAQTVDDVEVIVVDDGSTDGTAARASSSSDPRLHVVRQQNGGLANALNAGLTEARGRFIGFLDADDLWHPRKAERHLALMYGDPQLGVTYSHSEYITEEGEHTGRYLLSRSSEPSPAEMIRRNQAGNGSASIFSAACLNAAGPFDGRLRSSQEHEMLVRILSKTRYRVRLISEPLTYYRIRATSLTQDSQVFLANCRLSIAIMREYVDSGVPARVFREALATGYRIASRKAASAGERKLACGLMLRALREAPELLLTDARSWGTLALIVLGQRGEGWLYNAKRMASARPSTH